MGKKTYNSQNIESFSFQLYSADLDIIQTDDDKITIETDAILDQDYEIIENPKNLQLIEKRHSFINFSFFSSSKSFTILLPTKISLFISIASGDLSINNMSKNLLNLDKLLTKTMDIKLTSGDFSAENISAAMFIFSSTSSDLSISNSYLGKTKLKGISSDIELENCYVDELEAKNISGDIYLELLSFNSINADLKSGDISIICPKTKINGQFNTLSGDIDMDGVEIDKSIKTPYAYLHTLSGDIYIKGKFNKPENPFTTNVDVPVKSTFEEDSKKDDKEKFIQLLLDGKIAEKDAVELLKSFGFSNNEIDMIFEEYLFRKANKGEKNE